MRHRQVELQDLGIAWRDRERKGKGDSGFWLQKQGRIRWRILEGKQTWGGGKKSLGKRIYFLNSGLPCYLLETLSTRAPSVWPWQMCSFL